MLHEFPYAKHLKNHTQSERERMSVCERERQRKRGERARARDHVKKQTSRTILLLLRNSLDDTR